MIAPRSLAPLLLFLALAGAAVAQRPAPPAVAPVAPATAPAPAPVAATPPPAAAKDAGKSLPPAAGAKPTVATPPRSPRFLQVRSRIDALFRHRNEAPPPYDPKANPFRGSVAVGPAGAVVGSAGPAAGPAQPPPPPGNPEMQLLQQAAAALKVAGVIQINGRDHLIINQAPYKEGDVIIGRAKGQPVYLRLKTIARLTFTLTYNNSELVVKY